MRYFGALIDAALLLFLMAGVLILAALATITMWRGTAYWPHFALYEFIVVGGTIICTMIFWYMLKEDVLPPRQYILS